LPPAFLGFPTTGEVFESTAACKARLQGFSLGQGFAVVVGKSNKDAYVEFLCIHHGTETRNNREDVLTVTSLAHTHGMRNPFGSSSGRWRVSMAVSS
jgi:hypothetical protein